MGSTIPYHPYPYYRSQFTRTRTPIHTMNTHNLDVMTHEFTKRFRIRGQRQLQSTLCDRFEIFPHGFLLFAAASLAWVLVDEIRRRLAPEPEPTSSRNSLSRNQPRISPELREQCHVALEKAKKLEEDIAEMDELDQDDQDNFWNIVRNSIEPKPQVPVPMDTVDSSTPQRTRIRPLVFTPTRVFTRNDQQFLMNLPVGDRTAGTRRSTVTKRN